MEDPAPELILYVRNLSRDHTNYKTYVNLLERVVKRTKALHPFPGQEYYPISFRVFRYGPFTLCRMTYSRGECYIEGCRGACGKCSVTGYGCTEKSHRDTEYEQAGINIAFTRAATQLFNKYVAQQGK